MRRPGFEPGSLTWKARNSEDGSNESSILTTIRTALFNRNYKNPINRENFRELLTLTSFK